MIETYLKKRLEKKKLLLMTHLVVGHPSLDDNLRMLEVMQKADADIVELQFPFSEPTADGPLFVKANQEALDRGMTTDKCFEFMEKASQNFDFPLLMMGYYNTVFAMGEDVFCARLKKAGGSGLIVPDLPINEFGLLALEAEKNDLDPILIVTPNCSDERIKEIASHSKGFIYCVARKGVTGKQTDFDTDLENYLQRVKSLTSLPIALGFGVSSSKDIDFINGKADMAIIGSAALKTYESGGSDALYQLLNF